MIDAHASVLNYIYNLLTGDDTLQGIMGTVRVKPQWNPPDTPKPYIIQMLTMKETDAPFPLRNGTLTLHLFDDDSNASRILNMRERLIYLLENKHFYTAEIISCRCWLADDGFGPDEPGVWHYVIIFNLRLYKSYEAAVILSRLGG